MVTVVGFRFRPTDDEIVDHYLRLKNLGDSTSRSYVDEAITTLDICSFDPWELPCQSRMESRDQVWYFFGRKEKKYHRGERQSRGTKSGFWKKTGVTMDVKRKRGNREKIGEKRVLMFYMSGSKSNWVMHEYHATCLSPAQNMTYTICKVQFKGEAREISSSAGEIVEHTHSLTTHMNKNNYGQLSTGSEELQNPPEVSGVLDKQQKMQLEVSIQKAFDSLLSYDWKSLLDVLDENEQSKTASMQKSLTSVLIGHR